MSDQPYFDANSAPPPIDPEVRGNLGGLLRAIREARGLTQAQVADEATTTQDAVCKYESGSKIPRAGTLYRLALALDVDCDVLCEAASLDEEARHEERLARGWEVDPVQRWDDALAVADRVKGGR